MVGAKKCCLMNKKKCPPHHSPRTRFLQKMSADHWRKKIFPVNMPNAWRAPSSPPNTNYKTARKISHKICVKKRPKMPKSAVFTTIFHLGNTNRLRRKAQNYSFFCKRHDA